MAAFVRWGLATNVPFVGDYDGDGKTDFGVRRNVKGRLDWHILYEPLKPVVIPRTGVFNWGLSSEGLFNKKTHVISNKKAIIWSAVWIALSMVFSLFIYYYAGLEKFSQFQSAYWIEKALSVDNLFVFILVFGFLMFPESCITKCFTGALSAPSY